jgi:hypothetical protein
MNIDEVNNKLKILIIIVLILSSVTFFIFYNYDLENYTNNNETNNTKNDLELRYIVNNTYCETLNMRIYNETHCIK